MPRNMGRWLVGLALLGGGLSGSGARAHGGFAETHSYTERRDHPEDQWMGFTQGALVSRDRGRSWRWVCAEAMGYGSWLPERFVWRADGSLLAATGTALVRSPDEGCTWSTAPGFEDAWVTGLAAHPTDDAVLYLSTGRPSRPNALYRSGDGGRTWTPTALSGDAVFSAVSVAPSEPRRLYVSGARGYAQRLFRSDDAGATWSEWPLARTGGFDFKVLAVSPVRPEVLWARVTSLGASGLPVQTVLRSEDGGETFQTVLEPEDPVVNLDVSGSGQTVWVATYNQLFRGREGEPFTRLSGPHGNACVTRVGNVLQACGSTWANDWELARSPDEGSTWTPVFSLRELQGVHACPAGTPVQTLCTPRWPQLAEQLGVSSGGADAGVPDAGPSTPGPTKSEGCGAAPGGGVLLPLWLVLYWRRHLSESPELPS